jgi:hypothetical protein
MMVLFKIVKSSNRQIVKSSNRQIADTILAEMGIYAVFFVVSEFVKVNDAFEMRKFVSEKIIPDMVPSLVLDCQGNMTWDDLG